MLLSAKDKDDLLLGPGLAIILPNIPAYSTFFALLSQILLLAYIFLNPACGPVLQVPSAVTFYILLILHILKNATVLQCYKMLNVLGLVYLCLGVKQTNINLILFSLLLPCIYNRALFRLQL